MQNKNTGAPACSGSNGTGVGQVYVENFNNMSFVKLEIKPNFLVCFFWVCSISSQQMY